VKRVKHYAEKGIKMTKIGCLDQGG